MWRVTTFQTMFLCILKNTELLLGPSIEQDCRVLIKKRSSYSSRCVKVFSCMIMILDKKSLSRYHRELSLLIFPCSDRWHITCLSWSYVDNKFQIFYIKASLSSISLFTKEEIKNVTSVFTM